MKQKKDYTILTLLICLLLAIAGSMVSCKNAASEPIHNVNMCVQYVPARDYQIDIVEDTLLIFDGNRLVGKIPFEDSTAIGSLIVGDNE